MGQYYPQSGGYAPPPRGPEAEYYDDYEYEDDEYYEGEGDTLFQRSLFFVSGGCLVFLAMGACIICAVSLWVVDPFASTFATPAPGSDLGLTFEEPAFSDEPVVNDANIQLQILNTYRNIALENVQPAPGTELVVIDLALTNVGSDEASYNETDFRLLNDLNQLYSVSLATASLDGALGRGPLGPDEYIEGRLAFEVAPGETGLVLGWQGGRDVPERYIYIE